MWNIHYVPKALFMGLFKFLDFAVIIAGVIALVYLVGPLFHTYEAEKDNFGIQVFDHWDLAPKTGRHRPLIALSLLFMFATSVACCWWFVRTSASSAHLTTYTCFNEAMSAVALLPQLWMFQKDKRVDALLGSFVAMIAFNRICTLLFWVGMPFLVVHSWAIPSNRNIQMALEAMNLLILSDFLYYWARAKIRGEREIVFSDDCGV